MITHLHSPPLLWSLIFILAGILVYLLLLLRHQVQHAGLQAAAARRYDYEMLRIRHEVEKEALDLVSRELNDNIGQVLASAYMQLAAVSAGLNERSELRELISPAVTGIMKSIRALGQLSLVPDTQTVEKMGFIDAMEKELSFIASVYHLDCIFNYANQVPEFSREQDLLLFRIVQETLGCICRYTPADKATIDIGFADQQLRITIQHNGTVAPGSPFENDGLYNIRERMKLLNGGLTVTRDPGKGATLVLTCNLNT